MALGWPVSENGPAPAPADLRGRQVQVDERSVLRRAARRTGSGPGSTGSAWRREVREQPRRLEQVFLRDAAHLRDLVRRALAHRGLQRVEAVGVRRDVLRVDPAFPQHQVQHAVEQHHVGAGLDGQVTGRRSRPCRCGAGRPR